MATRKKPPSGGTNDKPAPAPTVLAFTAGADPLAVAPSAITQLPAELASIKLDPIPYDQDAAIGFLNTWRPRLNAIGPDRLKAARVNLDAVGAALLSVSALVEVPSLRALYTNAAKSGEFVFENLASLRALAQIALYAYRRAEEAGAFASSAKIPADLDKTSAEIEARMQHLLEHFFSNDEELGPILRRPRSGCQLPSADLSRSRGGDNYADTWGQRHHTSCRALIRSCFAKSFALSPPACHRATRVAHSARVAIVDQS